MLTRLKLEGNKKCFYVRSNFSLYEPLSHHFSSFSRLGFNGGSAVSANASAALAVTNSNISAAAGFFSWVFLEYFTKGQPSAVGAVTGAICGHVANTPASGYIYPGFAIIIGLAGSIVAFASTKLKPRLAKPPFNLDDSLDVFVVHGVSGIIGALLTGVFASTSANPNGQNGLIYGNPRLLLMQFVAVAVVIGISIAGTAIILLLLRFTIGLRFSETYELNGIDVNLHGEKVVFHEEETGYMSRIMPTQDSLHHIYADDESKQLLEGMP
eukprot:TRINITY_DN3005_c0_g1_i2.p2 TRINITY_DN3005_c0_g1~~TRINITY_DN3005_c0_g1_i2.p2  ORF type:complete len:269 (-),score=33.96 TRINITY_DN3005_c0_g1_i2:1148-1954(-)